MGKVVQFTGLTTLDHEPDQVLEAALGKLDTCVVIGYNKDGSQFFASSSSDGGMCMWLLEQAKAALLNAAASVGGE